MGSLGVWLWGLLGMRLSLILRELMLLLLSRFGFVAWWLGDGGSVRVWWMDGGDNDEGVWNGKI